MLRRFLSDHKLGLCNLKLEARDNLKPLTTQPRHLGTSFGTNRGLSEWQLVPAISSFNSGVEKSGNFEIAG